MNKPLVALMSAVALSPTLAAAQAALAVAAPVESPASGDSPTSVMSSPGVQVSVSGYVRTLFSSVFDSPSDSDFIGQYDGFQMADARLKVDARRGASRVHVALDGAVDHRASDNTAQGEIDARLTEAFVEHAIIDGYLKLTAGQFEAPFDAEEETSTEDLVFTDHAVESRGVHGVEGYNLSGLSLDYQVGVMLSSDPLYFGPGADSGSGFGLAYSVAATNGNAARDAQNDNDALAYTARLSLMYGPWVTLGAGYHRNELTTGAPPDRLTLRRDAMAFDLRASAYGVHVLGQFVTQSDDVVEVKAEPSIDARGYHAQVWYDAPYGLTPGYRFAHLDPTVGVDAQDPIAAERIDTDAITVHTVGLSATLPDEVLTVKVNYNVVLEDKARAVDNDRVDLLFQGAF